MRLPHFCGPIFLPPVFTVKLRTGLRQDRAILHIKNGAVTAPANYDIETHLAMDRVVIQTFSARRKKDRSKQGSRSLLL